MTAIEGATILREITIIYDPEDEELKNFSFSIAKLEEGGCDCYPDEDGDEEKDEDNWKKTCGEKIVGVARHDDYNIYTFCAQHWKEFCRR
ncbi:MAG: hypothetical protein DDT23_01236 [candidate division WS2 bacterium]|nr:hypothetical protein [Candidatus Lithacetigena glycinireducens]